MNDAHSSDRSMPGDPESTDEPSDSLDPEWRREPRFALLEVVLDATGTPVDAEVILSSPAYDRHVGVESAVGRRLSDISPDVPPDIPPEWYEIFHRVSLSGRARRFVRPSPMHGVLMEVTVVPAGPPESRRVGMVAMVAGEEKQVEAELRRANLLLEGIAEETDDLIAAEDHDFRFVYYNRAYAREFKTLWGRDLRIGDSMLDLMAPWPDELRKARELWQRALDGESFRVETEFGPTPEDTRTYDLRFSPLHDATGHVVGAAHIFRDITDRVRAEAELRESARRKDEFLAMLGHELRNPLAAIRHATELVKRSGADPARIVQAAETLDRQTAQMGRLIDGLLEVSRVASGKISLVTEALDLAEVVTEVVADHGGRMTDSGLALERTGLVEGVLVTGDRVRLAQIIDNLLVNAIKFTEEDGRVTVDVALEGEEAVVRVRDTGIGIAPERLEQIFEAFHQERSTAGRGEGGLGLGLALARGLARLHQGSLVAASQGHERGSEFTLTLPRTEGVEVEEATGGRATGGPGYRLLLVEDHIDAAEMLILLLEAHGHSATTVPSGAAALEALEDQTVEIVLSDIGLPDMSGYQLAQRIRAEERWSDLRLVALTGFGQAADRKRAMEAGFDAHLTKPVTVEEIETTLAELTGAGSD